MPINRNLIFNGDCWWHLNVKSSVIDGQTNRNFQRGGQSAIAAGAQVLIGRKSIDGNG